MSKIIDVTGKKSVNCPECGFAIDVPLREISMEKLRHIRDVKKVSELLKKTKAGKTVALNTMILICPNCGKPIPCKDKLQNANSNRR